MRSVFTPGTMLFRDRAIIAPDDGRTDRGYAIGDGSKVLLWASLYPRIPLRSVIDTATLRITLLGMAEKPCSLGIAALRNRADPFSATWLDASPGQPWGTPGVGADDMYDYASVSLVPSTNKHTLLLDVTGHLRGWVTRGVANYGWVFSGNARIAGATSLLALTAPTLDVRYSGERSNASSPIAGLADGLGG